ncbi:IDEAL domain-containing protein [Bacillus xiapuensis]|uniref:IDEAL domain-containing protein n=1 Tax=Bacillus xiapuensis TaxID=2014075 RepID=A0ABU6ND09_9BACI|nr:IDEAL domain-containing protein [Bacillus xiapuensis]
MEKKKPYKNISYSEIMKLLNSSKKTQDESSKLDLYIQNILDEAMATRQITLLEEKINDALVSMDKPLFLELAAKYNKLRHQQQMLIEKRRHIYNKL